MEICTRGYLSKNCQGLEGYTRESSFPLISSTVDTEKKATEENVKRKSGCLQTGRVYKEASLRFSFSLLCLFLARREKRLFDEKRGISHAEIHGKDGKEAPRGVFAWVVSVKLPAMLDAP